VAALKQTGSGLIAHQSSGDKAMAHESVGDEINRLILGIERRLPALRQRCSSWPDERSAASSSLREIESATIKQLRLFSRMLDMRVGPLERVGAAAYDLAQREEALEGHDGGRTGNSH
jgi:hypothetical protein